MNERQPQLTEEERGIWRAVYALHEDYADGEWSPARWQKFATKMAQMYVESGQHPLMLNLLIGLYDYYEAREKAGTLPKVAEQMTMEGIR